MANTVKSIKWYETDSGIDAFIHMEKSKHMKEWWLKNILKPTYEKWLVETFWKFAYRHMWE